MFAFLLHAVRSAIALLSRMLFACVAPTMVGRADRSDAPFTRRFRQSPSLAVTAGMGCFAVAILAVADAPGAAAQSECATYISGDADNPASGTLVGSKAVTDHASLGGGFGPVQGEVGRSETYIVGIYEMSDGKTIQVRCDDYTLHKE